VTDAGLKDLAAALLDLQNLNLCFTPTTDERIKQLAPLIPAARSS
jgi:hypothetical protein